MIHRPAVSFRSVLRQQRPHDRQQLVDLGLQPRGEFSARLFRARPPGAAPDDPGDRGTALLSLCEQPLPGLRIGSAVHREATRQVGRQLVEPGNQPGAVAVLGGVARRRWRHLLPAEGVHVPGGVAAESAQQRLAGRAFHRELANSAQLATFPIHEIEVEDLGFAFGTSGLPPRAAVKPPRHFLPQLDPPISQRQEQVGHPVFGRRENRREGREGDSGAQVQQHRMDRLATELFGQFVADGDVANRLAVTGPQRFERRGPGGTPGEFHVGEGVEQLLRTHPAQPLACGIDGLRRLQCRLVVETRDDPAVGVQRPLGVAVTVWAAVDLEGPATPSCKPSSSGCNVSCTSREAFSGRMIGS